MKECPFNGNLETSNSSPTKLSRIWLEASGRGADIFLSSLATAFTAQFAIDAAGHGNIGFAILSGLAAGGSFFRFSKGLYDYIRVARSYGKS